MNILLINDLENRSIITEKDKQELLSLNNALDDFNPLGNLTLIDRNVSSLLEETITNSSNPMIVTLKGDLNKKIHDIGTNVGTLISGNTTENVTGGLAGLPPLTIGDFWDDEHKSLRLTRGCQAVGTAVSGVAIGSYNYALCGGGAVTHFSYWDGGSYLWSLEPVTEDTSDPAKQSFTAKAKDHHRVDPATITVYAMGVRLHLPT